MLDKVKEYFETKDASKDCIFCKIINKELPAKIVAENSFCMAFMDISPYSDGHVLVIPKKHCIDLAHCDDMYLKELILMTKKVSLKIDDCELQPWGFNYLSNQGAIAGQVVNHFHMHIIPKYAKSEGFEFSSPNKNVEDIDIVHTKIEKSKFKID